LVSGVAFDELWYCALDDTVASVSVHLEGTLASERELLRFCDGVGAHAEEWENGDVRVVACELEVPSGVISGSYAEIGARRSLMLSRENRGVMESFYARSRAEIVQRARDGVP
jgi:hypothetical protein